MGEALVEVYRCGGGLEAETFRIFLESRGFQVMISQESAGAAHGLTIGPLGMARIYVLAEQAEEARSYLRAMEQGQFDSDARKTDRWAGKQRWKKKWMKKKIG